MSAGLHFRINHQKGNPMNIVRSCKLVGISMLLAAGLSACDNPGPAEAAGKKIDQTANEAGRKIVAAADKVGQKLDAQSARTGAAIDDAEITAKVKAAFFAEPGLRTLQISVDTVKGVVTLSGSVDSPLNSARAYELAHAVAGADVVDNRLVAKGAPSM